MGHYVDAGRRADDNHSVAMRRVGTVMRCASPRSFVVLLDSGGAQRWSARVSRHLAIGFDHEANDDLTVGRFHVTSSEPPYCIFETRDLVTLHPGRLIGASVYALVAGKTGHRQ